MTGHIRPFAGWARVVAAPGPPTDPDVRISRIRLLSDTDLLRDRPRADE
jgi:hypothetical protein